MKDGNELKNEIKRQIFVIAEKVLNYADLCIPEEKGVYKKFRGKTLGVCNDTIRELELFIDDDIESQ
jgi:hypothetical protein